MSVRPSLTELYEDAIRIDDAETLRIISRGTYHVQVSSLSAIHAAHLSKLTLGPHTPPLTIPILFSLLHAAGCLESVSVLGAPFASIDGDPVKTSPVTTYATKVHLDVASEVLECILRLLSVPHVETLTLVGSSGWFPLSELFIYLVCALPILLKRAGC